jgi:FkbH-like protein
LDEADRLVVLHSSLPHLGREAAGAQWDLLYALRMLVERGLTLALPAFTFSFCRRRPFHLQRSASETGVLADWAREHFADAIRTPHPIYSFVALGPLADRIAACPSSTTFGDDSPFALFEELDARLLMLGCDWHYCTQLHRYEESAKVPYRYAKTFVGQADIGAGLVEARATMFVRDLAINPENDFGPAIEKLRASGAVASVPVLDGVGEAVSCRELASVCASLLRTDPWAFVADGKAVAYRAAARRKAAEQPPFRVALLSSANAALLEKGLAAALAALAPDWSVEVHTPPYGQMAQAILDPQSTLAGFQPRLSYFPDRLEDVLGVASVDGTEPARVEEKVRAYAALVRRQHEGQTGWSVVHLFAPLERSAFASAEHLRQDGPAALAARGNTILRKELAGLPQLHFLDPGREASAFDGPVLDPRLWLLGRFPYAELFSRHLAARWAALALGAAGRAVRLIVLDLDNTLWGGVLGEEGMSGVQIGGDYPGNAFAAFQAVLKRLSARGIALAVASKNDASLAISAMDALPGMLLRSKDLVSQRINWDEKWRNVESMCSELSLGLESVLFIDDNPVERERMRRNLPAVKVLDLPADPALHAKVLLECPWIEALTLTAEDYARTESYRARSRIVEARQGAANLEDFFASLGMRLHLAPLEPGNSARAAQLLAKTNQFNATTRRYSQRQLEELCAAGSMVVVVGLEDRHTPLENIGVLILRSDTGSNWLVIDTYLLSCRVLGRGLEQALVRWVVETARRQGRSGVSGEIIETERNAPVRSVYADAGFTPGESSGMWRRAVTSDERAEAMPAWLEVVDRVNGNEK